MLSCGDDKTIRIWDISRKGMLLKTIEKQFDNAIVSVDFNNESSKIVACSSMDLKLINASSENNIIHECSKAFNSEMNKALLNGDGSNLLFLQNQIVIKVIDTATGKEKYVISTEDLQ